VAGVDPIVLSFLEWNGNLIVGGGFSAASGVTVNDVAAWQACPYRGARCVNGAVVEIFADECAAIGGVFRGEEVPPDEVECAPACVADLNGDDAVGVSDLLMIVNAWGPCL
jgi:hypothetical protein